eukprot:m.180651 g.180651  ORF g.180651 m.180651 type:complete len:333 (+) comp32032_c0_seq2:277-1275(+)
MGSFLLASVLLVVSQWVLFVNAAEPAFLSGITATTNSKRALHGVGDMTWSDTIATSAQSHANSLYNSNSQCSFQHSVGSGYGENLASRSSASTGGYPAPSSVSDGPTPVNSWYNEIDCYTYPTAAGDDGACNLTCTSAMYASGCGHFTALVWKKTTEMGCGYTTCQYTDQGYKWTQVVTVCQYGAEVGNVIGQYYGNVLPLVGVVTTQSPATSTPTTKAPIAVPTTSPSASPTTAPVTPNPTTSPVTSSPTTSTPTKSPLTGGQTYSPTVFPSNAPSVSPSLITSLPPSMITSSPPPTSPPNPSSGCGDASVSILTSTLNTMMIIMVSLFFA